MLQPRWFPLFVTLQLCIPLKVSTVKMLHYRTLQEWVLVLRTGKVSVPPLIRRIEVRLHFCQQHNPPCSFCVYSIIIFFKAGYSKLHKFSKSSTSHNSTSSLVSWVQQEGRHSHLPAKQWKSHGNLAAKVLLMVEIHACPANRGSVDIFSGLRRGSFPACWWEERGIFY